ncbi:MAG TPA: hypothetical protein VMH38_01695 [Thermoplasmata archaeon]|nr:hypothetical protein [Thermoplasmata archaeon]
MLTRERVQQRLADLEHLVQEEYKPRHPPKKRDERTYEEQWAHRIRSVMRDLGPLVHEACSVGRLEGPGPKPILTLEQKETLLLLKVLYEQSNRRMAGMLVTFSLLSGLDVSYKTVERLYSDPAVAVALENLHTLMLRRRGIAQGRSDRRWDGVRAEHHAALRHDGHEGGGSGEGESAALSTTG